MEETDTLNSNSLKDTQIAPIIGYIPDLHVATDALNEVGMTLLERANGKDACIVLSDVDERKDRAGLARQFGVPHTQEYVGGLLSNALADESERVTFEYLFAIDFYGGIEKYIELVRAENPTFDVEKERKRYQQKSTEAKNTGLEGKIREIMQANKEQISQDISELKTISMSLDRAISRYNMDRVAREVKIINEVAAETGLGQLKVIAGAGNHDTEYDVSLLQEALGKDVVYNAHELKGSIEFGEGDERIRFQIAGNCYGINQQFDQQAYTPEEVKALYPHMLREEAIVEDFRGEDLPRIREEGALRSSEYQRMRAGESKDSELDFLLLHYEVGEPMGFEGRSLYRNLDSVGVLYTIANHLRRDEEGFARVYSGHLHGEANGKYQEWGIRKARNYATIIDKTGEEILDISSKHPKLEYDLNEVQRLFNEEYNRLIEQTQAPDETVYDTTSSDSSDFAQAA